MFGEIGPKLRTWLNAQSGTPGQALVINSQNTGVTWATLPPAINFLQYGGDNTGTRDNSAALQAIINGFVTTATAKGSTLGNYAILIPGGTYKFLSGITTRPWIKLISQGNVLFDFTNLTGTVSAIRCYNSDDPGTGEEQFSEGNTGYWLNGDEGVIFINGPGSGSTVTGLDVGNTSASGASEKTFRDTKANNFIVRNFMDGLFLRNCDDYLSAYMNFRIDNCTNCIHTQGTTNTNSGERMLFLNGTIDSSTNAMYLDAPGFDLSFISCSFDYFSSQVIDATSNCTYSKVSFLECHIENFVTFFNGAGSSGNYLEVTLKNCKMVPTTYYIGPAPTGSRIFNITGCANNGSGLIRVTLANNISDTTGANVYISGVGGTTEANGFWNVTRISANVFDLQGSAFVHTYTSGGTLADGQSTPFQPLFFGQCLLTIDGLNNLYAKPYNLANTGIFVTDNNQTLIKYKTPIPINQMVSRASQLLYNGNFNLSTVTVNLDQADIPGWTRSTFNGISCVVDNSVAFSPSTLSLKFTSSTASGNYYVIRSEPVRIPTEGWFTTLPIAYGGTSTGSMQIQTNYYYYAEQTTPPVPISSLTYVSSGVAQVITTQPHNLASGQVITLVGANQSTYNRRSFITVVTASNVTNCANNGSGLIRVTVNKDIGIQTGYTVTIAGVVGTTEANGTWTVTRIDATHYDLQSSTFTNAYSSGGTFTVLASQSQCFTYTIQSGVSPTSPATTNGFVQYYTDNLVNVGNLGAYGASFSTLYSNQDDPNYTGGRAFWCRDQYTRYVGALELPPGTTHIRVEITVSGLANGDVINLGEVLANYQ